LQGIKSGDQGNFFPHQGIRSRPLFWPFALTASGGALFAFSAGFEREIGFSKDEVCRDDRTVSVPQSSNAETPLVRVDELGGQISGIA
jgi:hypothetical protein